MDEHDAFKQMIEGLTKASEAAVAIQQHRPHQQWGKVAEAVISMRDKAYELMMGSMPQ